MNNTTQLKALRDAMTERNPVTGAQPLCMVSRADIDRAIASLEAAEPVAEEDGWSVARCVRCGQTWTFNVTPPMCAVRGTSMRCTPIPRAHEQPKPCAGFVCGYSPTCVEPHSGDAPCRKCDQPYSAHQQPPAEQAQQPAYAPAPPMPPRHTKLAYAPDELLCHERDVADLHAACERIAAERDEAKRNANEVHERFMQAASERDEAAARNEGILLDMQTLLHERDEARRELEAERAGRPGSINAMTITSLRERLAEAEAELAALKGYAAPVAIIPLALHEAALAQARREERERCAVVADENGAMYTARAIRALAEEIK